MNDKFKKWIKGIGLVTFLFFTVKGLAWIAVFYFGYQWVTWHNPILDTHLETVDKISWGILFEVLFGNDHKTMKLDSLG